jgi:4-amino-4-deoxyprephenate dehydrogenase
MTERLREVPAGTSGRHRPKGGAGLTEREPLAGQRCVVVGGAGAVGVMFADLLARSGAEVCVVDTTSGPPELPGGSTRYVRGDVTNIGPRLAAEIAGADLVLLAVPERVALAAVKPVIDLMRPGALLADTLSVKARVVDAVRADTRGVEMVSINPMFAPSLGFQGRPIAAVVVHDGPRARDLLRLLDTSGARVVRVTADQHDRLAGAVQALTHATVLAFGLALADLDVDITELTALAPPPHATLLALLARIVSGTPEVYWDVQSANPQALRAHQALAGGVRRLTALVEAADEAGFAAVLDQLREFLRPDLERYRGICGRVFADVTNVDS